MTGKTIMIAGASSGIGKACAEKMAGSGNQLILLARDETRLNLLAEKLPCDTLVISYDLFQTENIKQIFETVREKQWKLDAMVYSAGMDANCPFKVNSVNLLEKTMTLNCFSFFEMCKFFYSARYSHEGGSIVAISSIASELFMPGQGPYTVSKAAMNAGIKTMSKEFVRRRIRVNAVLPAGVSTPMSERKTEVFSDIHTTQTEKGSQSLGAIPAASVADSVEFLLSERSAYITGELLKINAGI